MITKQHVLIAAMAIAAKARSKEEYQTILRNELPWVLLPDAIRKYIGPRHISHFEKTPNGADTSWIIFPNETTLKLLSSLEITEFVQFYHAKGYPDCAIGEKTSIEKFDELNWTHKHYHAIRSHLLQDVVFDEILRERMIDKTKRFLNCYPLKKEPNQEIDGETLRTQISMFEEYAFLKLTKAFYDRTGFVANRKWFDENVKTALLEAYSTEMAEHTYAYMDISEEQEDIINMYALQERESIRIPKYEELLEEEKTGIFILKDRQIEELIAEMHYTAYLYTHRELL